MKPKLMIKTVKGHRYLQLSDIYGALVHIGSAENLENWAVGMQALGYCYEGLALKDALDLDREKAAEAIRIYRTGVSGAPEAWEKFSKKWIQTRANQHFLMMRIDGIADDKLMEELVEYRTNLEAIFEISHKVGLSPDAYELLRPFTKRGVTE